MQKHGALPKLILVSQQKHRDAHVVIIATTKKWVEDMDTCSTAQRRKSITADIQRQI